MADDIVLQVFDLLLHAVHQMDIRLHVLAHAVVGEAIGDIVPIGMPSQFGLDAGQIVLIVHQFDMALNLGSAVHEVITPAQQVPGGPHRLRIDMSQGEITAPHQPGDLLGIALVVL